MTEHPLTSQELAQFMQDRNGTLLAEMVFEDVSLLFYYTESEIICRGVNSRVAWIVNYNNLTSPVIVMIPPLKITYTTLCVAIRDSVLRSQTAQLRINFQDTSIEIPTNGGNGFIIPVAGNTLVYQSIEFYDQNDQLLYTHRCPPNRSTGC
jgi:hypothetical protein